MPKRKNPKEVDDKQMKLTTQIQKDTSVSSKKGTQPTEVTLKNDRQTKKAERQEFFIPISGFVWLYPEEVEVVNHPVFQRLGRINQLGQTYLVYRGATHKRFEHVLGTVNLVQRMIDAVRHTSDKASLNNDPCVSPLQSSEERFVRLGALLHDIGHIAAGHTVEDELNLIGHHDSDERLSLLFKDERRNWTDTKGRTLGELIDFEFSKYLPDDFSTDGIRASELVWVLIRKESDNDGDARINEIQSIVEKKNSIRLNVCRNIIGNTICADLLDYLHRDWYHVGKPRPFDERILQYMEIRSTEEISNGVSCRPKASDEFVISLGRRPKIRTDAVSAILELLEWRYQLAESILFHRTKVAAAAMLDRALYELWGNDDPGVIESILFPLSDEQLLAECRRLAEKKSKEGRSKEGKEKATTAANILCALEKRQLYTGLCTYSYEDFPEDVRSNIQAMYGRSPNDLNLAPLNRANTLLILEQDFRLPPGSLAMYCPTSAMNAKIAEVKIMVNNEIERFCDYEQNHSNLLSGGHLDAQLHRFKRLWKIYFFIKREVKEQYSDILVFLRDAIKKLALGHLGYGDDFHEVAIALAESLTTKSNFPWYECSVVDSAVSGAYKDATMAVGTYPSGAKSLRSFIQLKDASEN